MFFELGSQRTYTTGSACVEYEIKLTDGRPNSPRKFSLAGARMGSMVNGWVRPVCSRLLAGSNKSDDCASAMTLDHYFSTGQECERPIFQAVLTHVEE
ncbi:MAG: hypothetical protein ACREA0_22645, partial [bacterium]